MTIDTDTKLREGDIVSVQGKIELIYNSSASGEERIVIKLDGYYQSVGIAREHLTFVSPHIEEGMLVYDEDKEDTYRVLSVLDGDWVVGRLRGIAGARPEILRSCALRVEDEPKRCRRDDDELPAAEPAPFSDEAIQLEREATGTHREPPLGPTTVDQGYPQHPRDDAAELVKSIANTVTDTYRKAHGIPSDENAEQEPRRTVRPSDDEMPF
jgi:hypothetical protein